MKKLRLRAVIEFDVEVPDDPEYNAVFDLTENHCIGTGIPGASITALMEKHEANHTCWGCHLQQGDIEIVEDKK